MLFKGIVESEIELLGKLAILRLDLANIVADTDINDKEHKLALMIWRRIEEMRPIITPETWCKLAQSAERMK